MNKAEFIRRELGKLSNVDFSNPEQAKILCCFHPDTNPSLDIRLRPKTKQDGTGKSITIGVGTFNCWSCKEHGSWNKLAQKLGLEPWDQEKEEEYADHPENPFNEIDRALKAMDPNTTVYLPPVTDGPWEGPWRGLTGKFLRSIGAESLWDAQFGEYRLWLPIEDAFGNLVGHVAARGDKSNIPDQKKYLNSKGFNGRSYWYGLAFEKKPSVLVIVEGPFDMLRFRSEGIPAIANLGVQLRNEANLDETVSEQKIMQILATGCSRVILALDADRAGREATIGFTASFRKWGIEVFDLNLSRYLKSPDEKMDPGNAPMEVISDLKAFIESLK